MKDNKIIGLSILRIVVCMAVFFVHLNTYIGIGGPIGKLMNRGAEGPAFFYVLSGFLAFLSQELREGEVFKYYKKRMIRILPPYYIVTFLQFLYWIYDGTNSLYKGFAIRYWGQAFLFLNIFGSNTMRGSIVWSTGNFVWFYFLVPLLYGVLKTPKKAGLFSVGVFLVSHMIEMLYPGCFISGFMHALFFFSIGIVMYFMFLKESYFTVGGIISIIIIYVLVAVEHYNRLALAAEIYLIVGFLTQLDFSRMGNEIKVLIRFFDRLTYPVFLIHGMVLEIILGKSTMRGGIIFALVVTLVLSWVITEVINRVVSKCFIK